MFTAAAVEEDHSNEYDVEINIAVVGDLGVGKSSIIDYETRETLQPSSSTDPYDGIHFKTKYYKDKVQFKMPETQEVVDPVKPGTESRRVNMSVNNSSNSLLSNMPKKGAGPLDKPFQFNKAALAQAHEYTVKVNYWDCSGNEEYLDLTCRLATGMAGVVYVYDVCNRSTFDDIELWMSELEELAPGKIDTDLDFVRMLLGNQSNIGIEPGSALAKLHHGKDVIADDAKGWAQERDMIFYETNCLNGHNVNLALTTLRLEIEHQLFYEMPREHFRNKRDQYCQKGVRFGDRLFADFPGVTPVRLQYDENDVDLTYTCDWL